MHSPLGRVTDGPDPESETLGNSVPPADLYQATRISDAAKRSETAPQSTRFFHAAR